MGVLVACGWVATATGQASAGSGQVAMQLPVDYDVLDDSPRDATNFNVPITHSMEAIELNVSPFVALLAVNPHNHEVVAYTSGTTPVERFKTPMNPVALNWLLRDPLDDFDDQLVVICRATHVLVLMDPLNDGEYLGLVQLPSEPADLVVTPDETLAFVSCANADQVVTVDIDPASPTFMTVVETFDIPSKRPTWLSIDVPDPVGAPNVFEVYVAPMISGNNTTVMTAGPGGAVFPEVGVFEDLIKDLSNEPGGGLLDTDLFRLVRGSGTVERVVKGAGSILAAHGRHPNGEYWMLATQSLNFTPPAVPFGPGQTSEAQLTGKFARHELVKSAVAPGSLVQPTNFIDLDPHTIGPGGEHVYDGQDPSEMIAGPWALAFAPDGKAFVSGMRSDRVAVLNPDGSRHKTLILPDGSIPRAIEIYPFYDQGLEAVYVQCWGTNTIEVFLLTQAPPADVQPFQTLEVGLDPAPPEVQRGREIYYDASRSANNRLTCGTCHPDLGADGLAWNLSDLPGDNKGPLTTQMLLGLEALAPYHWRGERDELVDFNVAFVGLLGADCRLTPAEFADFQAFVFSGQVQANPRQSADRKLRGRAALGQDQFQTVDTSVGDGFGNPLTCSECHALPTGANADMVPEVVSAFPARVHLDVTQLNNGNLTLKDQSIENVDIGGTIFQRNTLGSGLLHNGSQLSVDLFVANTFGFDAVTAANVSAFVNRFDFGIAPAAHLGWMMTSANATSVAADVQDALDQADQAVPGCGVVVYPADNVGTRWAYRGSGVFVSDTSPATTRTLQDFVDDATMSGLDFVFFGVPPGNHRRIGLDFDGDGLVNQAEASVAGTDPLNPDTDGDSWLDGYEIANPGSHALNEIAVDPTKLPTDTAAPTIVELQPMWTNARTMKAYFRTNEPCSFDVQVTAPAGTPAIPNVVKTSYGIHHTIIVQDMIPSPTGGASHNYVADITVTDMSGNPSPPMAPNSTFSFDPLTGCIDSTSKVGLAMWDESATVSDCGAGTLEVKARFRLDLTGTDPTPTQMDGFAVFAYLLKRTPNPDNCNGEVHDTTPWTVHGDFVDQNGHPPTFRVELNNGVIVDYDLENGITWFPSISQNPNPDDLLLSTRSDASGICEFHFEAQNLTCGEEIAVRVLGAMPVDPGWPTAMDSDIVQSADLFQFSVPETDSELRELTRIFQ